MEKSRFFFLILTAALAYGAVLALHEDSARESNRRILAPPPEQIEYMHVGFRWTMADSFWLRWIQDSDICYAYSGPVKMDPSTKKPPEPGDYTVPRYKECDVSWGFKMLDAVTKLDPKFLMPYLAGTMALAVLVEDYAGASVIFDRGLAVYPDDWQLSYRAAYHFLFDVNDYGKAAKLLENAAAKGGPSWLRSLAARLYTKSGKIELGLSNLISYRETIGDDNPAALRDIDARIEALRALLRNERAK